MRKKAIVPGYLLSENNQTTTEKPSPQLENDVWMGTR